MTKSDERWEIERNGRLLLARWRQIRDREAAETYRAAVFEAMQRDRGNVIICGDWRYGGVLSPEAAEVLLAMLTGRSQQIERSAILLAPDKAVFDMQVERLVKQAGHPARRTFRDPRDVLAYLGERVTPEELEVVRTFLSAGH